MLEIDSPKSVVDRLIDLEAGVHYSGVPPAECQPFIVHQRESPVVFSAPHGAMTWRNNGKEKWHPEDEYTAGLALLLSEICKTSVIATVWCTEGSDPNEHEEVKSPYKQQLRTLVQDAGARWLIDLHGAAADTANMAFEQLVDLGAGRGNKYLPARAYTLLVGTFERYLGESVADRNGEPGFPASDRNRIAAFAHHALGLNSVQIEMKPSIRVARRRTDSSMYVKPAEEHGGQYSAPAENIFATIQSLVEFISVLQTNKEYS